jgi:two-component system sensor histidine kinase RegB
MINPSDFDLAQHARRLRLDTLVRLRWLAVLGQSTAALVTHYLLGFTLPIGFCFLAISTSAWLNIGLRVRFPVSQRLSDSAALALLAYDVLQLSGLLYLTGGLTNPFAILFLAPIMISAVSLPWQRTLWLVVLMIVMATVLAFFHLPLPWIPGKSLDLPFLYVVGIWIALALGAGFVAIYAARVSGEARQLSDALAATELVLAREQHLTQLDGLAAAAAHELGTPLATITLVVKEMLRHGAAEGPFADDVKLLSQEVQRCRGILSKIASLGDQDAGMFDEMTLMHLVEEVVGPHRDFGVELIVETDGSGLEPLCRRNPGMVYGLGNLVENAIDFARSEVRILAQWDDENVSLMIEDNGPGFSPDVLMRLGEPYVTSRGSGRRAKSEEGSGLGLGLFIAKTLLERSGASVTPGNVDITGGGAVVRVVWPRATFERKTGANVRGEGPATRSGSLLEPPDKKAEE